MIRLEDLSLTDLLSLKKMIEDKLEDLQIRATRHLGTDFESYDKAYFEYDSSPYHLKLDKINQRINEYYDFK